MTHYFGDENLSQLNVAPPKGMQQKYEEDLFFDWFSSVLLDETGHLKSLNKFQNMTEVLDVLYPTSSKIKNTFLINLFENQRQHLTFFPKIILEKYFKESQTIADFQNKITDALKANTNQMLAKS